MKDSRVKRGNDRPLRALRQAQGPQHTSLRGAQRRGNPLFNYQLIQLPDVSYVVFDCAVARELAGIGNINKCFAGPGFLVCISSGNFVLCFAVRIKVGKNVVNIRALTFYTVNE